MSYKKKQKKIAVYSEKGGVGKTTIITSIAYKICNIENAIFLDADSSSQSLSDVLKFYQLNPKIIYRDNICVLPFLSEIHNNTEFFFVDLAGREASLTEIEYFKYLDLIIVPIPPIYSNYSTPIHTIEKMLKNDINPSQILVLINNMWPSDNVDEKLLTEFYNCLDAMKTKYNVYYFRTGLSFSSNLNKHKNCIKTKSKYMQDIIKLSEYIKTIVIK